MREERENKVREGRKIKRDREEREREAEREKRE